MKALVTGSNGLVGSRIVRVLEARGYDVVKLTRADAELSDAKSVQSAIDRARPDVIFNPASMTEVDKCEADKERAFRDNVVAPTNLAVAARIVGAHLVHVSTDYVFDGDHGPYREDDIPNPRGVYATTKRQGEVAVEAMGRDFAIARTAVVYGWPQAARPNFGAWLYGVLSQKKEARLFEDQFVSPSLADNVAEMLVELGERKLIGTWNIAGAEVVSRVELGHAFCDTFGFDKSLVVPTKLAAMNLASPRPLHSGLVVGKAQKELKTKPLAIAEQLAKFRAAIEAG